MSNEVIFFQQCTVKQNTNRTTLRNAPKRRAFFPGWGPSEVFAWLQVQGRYGRATASEKFAWHYRSLPTLQWEDYPTLVSVITKRGKNTLKQCWFRAAMHGKEALLGKERYSLKMTSFSCQEGPSFIFFHDVEFLPAQGSEEESLCSLYGKAK